MIYDFKQALKKFLSSRLFVLCAIMVLMLSLVLIRVFSLQIVNGASYQEEFSMKIQRTLTVDATRGNIYDCNGKLLAYNELAYSIMISDNGTYSTSDERNEAMNAEIAQISKLLRRNGESLYNTFKIDYLPDGTYEFNVTGTQLKRFLADVFGKASYEELEYNEEFEFNEATASAAQVMQFLTEDDDCFQISEEYDAQTAYDIVVVRYAMLANRYTKYKSTTIAENVSDATVAYVNEHSNELTGVSIKEDTIRKYNDSEYFASIIGYTGRISDSEYAELSEKDKSYTANDTVGKAGLEQFYESYLRGTNGEQVVYVNNVGKISETISTKDSVAGHDLYLSLDADLQKSVYLLLEQEIAGIVYANIKSGSIPIQDVYFALINNNVIDIEHFVEEDATANEQAIHQKYLTALSRVCGEINSQLQSDDALTNNDMSDEMLDYFTRILSILKENEVLLSSQIDTDDEVYINWREGNVSPAEYFKYCISKQWIDITKLEVEEKYADTSQIYQALCQYILDEISSDKKFAKLVYKYIVNNNTITGKELCFILFEQGVLDYDETIYEQIKNGSLSPYSFLLDKINTLEITPAQLALDPCTGSCVITDVNTGEIKALVSYPGYDNNKLANGVDAEYFKSLNEDISNPQYNYATQEKTAPGSTFKMVTTAAGFAENVITTTTDIQCTGQFDEVSNKPKCWIHPGNHGIINPAEAIRDSCNVYYYTLGYWFSTRRSNVYNDTLGISVIQKYASIFGLDEKTGLEIQENTPEVADEYPVMAAIGQSNHNFTTASLSRYVTAIPSGKLYSYQLMNKIVGPDGTTVKSYTPEYEDISNTLTTEQWDTIHNGMKMVCEDLSSFSDFNIQVAGKTGTAQQVEDRPNHALFVGYAPYENPEISIAIRITYGYASSNAASVGKNVLSYYFGEQDLESLLALQAEGVNGSSSNTVTD